MRQAITFMAMTVLVGLVGCGSGSKIEGRQPVSGSVTLDGQPLDSGTIVFEPQGHSKTNASGRIEGGKYSIPAEAGPTAGKYKVSIMSSTSSGGVTASDPTEAMNQATAEAKTTKERIPAKYNKKTELEATVTDQAGQTFDFKVTSK